MRNRMDRGFLAGKCVLGVGLTMVFATTVALGAGRRPMHAPEQELPPQGQVAGFDVQKHGIAFRNYNIWKKSKLLPSTQLYHCAGMALMVRQVFHWAKFEPSLPKPSAAALEATLKKIYDVPTATLPGMHERIVIAGYHDLYELSLEEPAAEAIKNVLGDAFNDIFKPNWNWFIFDVFRNGTRIRKLIELNLRASVAAGRPALLYMTNYLKSAHAILLVSYQAHGDRVVYQAYDSNHPGYLMELAFRLDTGQIEHPDFERRDPWILHPYGDEFRAARAFIEQQAE